MFTIMFTAYSQYIHCIFTAGLLYIHCMFTIYSLYVHYRIYSIHEFSALQFKMHRVGLYRINILDTNVTITDNLTICVVYLKD